LLPGAICGSDGAIPLAVRVHADYLQVGAHHGSANREKVTADFGLVLHNPERLLPGAI